MPYIHNMPSTRNEPLHFSSSMDKGTKLKTLFVFLLFACIAGVSWYYIKDQPDLLPFLILLILIYAGIMSYGIAETPVRYTISDDTFSIVSRWNTIRIPLKDIQAVREFGVEDKKKFRKNLGAEGVLGNVGSYSSALHKELTLYTSRDTNWVLMTRKNGKKVVISPDDMGLVEYLRRELE